MDSNIVFLIIDVHRWITVFLGLILILSFLYYFRKLTYKDMLIFSKILPDDGLNERVDSKILFKLYLFLRLGLILLIQFSFIGFILLAIMKLEY